MASALQADDSGEVEKSRGVTLQKGRPLSRVLRKGKTTVQTRNLLAHITRKGRVGQISGMAGNKTQRSLALFFSASLLTGSLPHIGHHQEARPGYRKPKPTLLHPAGKGSFA